jgi:hypothetical protein
MGTQRKGKPNKERETREKKQRRLFKSIILDKGVWKGPHLELRSP